MDEVFGIGFRAIWGLEGGDLGSSAGMTYARRVRSSSLAEITGPVHNKQQNSVDGIFLSGYIFSMKWEVEYTDEFGVWWAELSEDEQVSVAASVALLEERGPNLGFPHSSAINGSAHSRMRELRTQHQGRPFRTLYAFDPRRHAILLIGGDKTGDDRWYAVHIPLADRLYDDHLKQLREQGFNYD